MMGKEGKASGQQAKVALLLAVSALSFLGFMAVDVSGLECSPGAFLSCGQPIDNTGYGAVELCQECFPCGIPDSVCPELYSDGSPETKQLKQKVLMRVGSDRPAPTDPNTYSIAFRTGTLACARIGAVCAGLEEKATESGTWTSSGDSDCNADVSSSSMYYRAVCSSVNRTAGCENCPDPDCKTQLSGIIYDRTSRTPIPAGRVRVSAVSGAATPITTATGDGEYTFEAFQGNVTLHCSADGYQPYVKQVYLQPGRNIYDCQMSNAECRVDCTLPDPDGNYVCRASCDGRNGCTYMNQTVMSQCDGLTVGAFVVLSRYNSTHVLGAYCCNGAVGYFPRPLFNLTADVRNLITQNARKEFQGLPVTLKILVYDK